MLNAFFVSESRNRPWRVGCVPTHNARLSAHSIIPNFYCHFCHYRDCDGGAVRLIGSQPGVFKNVIRRRLRISCVLPSASRRHCGSHISYPARDENWISHLKADIHSFLSIINLLAPPERGAHDFQHDEGRTSRRLRNGFTLSAESAQCLGLIDSESFFRRPKLTIQVLGKYNTMNSRVRPPPPPHLHLTFSTPTRLFDHYNLINEQITYSGRIGNDVFNRVIL